MSQLIQGRACHCCQFVITNRHKTLTKFPRWAPWVGFLLRLLATRTRGPYSIATHFIPFRILHKKKSEMLRIPVTIFLFFLQKGPACTWSLSVTKRPGRGLGVLTRTKTFPVQKKALQLPVFFFLSFFLSFSLFLR